MTGISGWYNWYIRAVIPQLEGYLCTLGAFKAMWCCVQAIYMPLYGPSGALLLNHPLLASLPGGLNVTL